MFNFFGKNSGININGKSYSGNNIIVNNGQVIVDGVVQDGTLDEKVTIVVESGVERITSDESIHIQGDVTGNVESSTSVNCNNVTGNVKAGTSVNCNNIGGNAVSGTSINCNNIKGNATAKVINRGM
ncbi:hypothetical protein BCP78_0070 [Bacillus phage BCP78]|uniref:Uncharacterized protein n=3 Tax=Tsarbombavirus BCP78 TaxID=1985182 RepID=J9PRA6_9CAUD|nr:hypothetical protein BCP78_0070 [Bacillus phage BCP78]YP_009783433.1 hypothetical protein QLX27_gp060 [Bacillus phage BCU4]AEW47077.1 hypothetical protein BCP78_0070 [Bacillus phage BCP78]AEW47566.1 hypothetical protein BCU4_0060 [Bacillus phage BCU4]AQN32444.1 hypothetical protein BCP12_021 [Bacillus phage BCP12]